MDRILRKKDQYLRNYIRSLGSLAVGFSAGVDSTFLLTVAYSELGDKAIAVTQSDPSVPRREIAEAKAFCEERGIRQFFCHADPRQEEEYRHNGKDRCYYCKRGIFTEIKKIAKEQGIEYVAEGSNMDDLGDYRPGLKAVEELSVVSPLREAGLTKAEIRELSRNLGLPTADKPSYACLASRFTYGEEITADKLGRIDLAEEFLIDHGFLVERVRMQGNTARIEVPAEDITRLCETPLRERICEEFRKLGFSFVTVDLDGYRMGSMNSTI